MEQKQKNRIKKILREMLVVTVSLAAVASVVQWVQAGSLTPPGTPSATMRTLQEVYDTMVGTTFDSTAITASASGSAIQITKCIIAKIRTGTCP